MITSHFAWQHHQSYRSVPLVIRKDWAGILHLLGGEKRRIGSITGKGRKFYEIEIVIRGLRGSEVEQQLFFEARLGCKRFVAFGELEGN